MYLIHRMSHEQNEQARLLEKGFISIGWSDLVKAGYGDEVIEKANSFSKREFADYFVKLGKELKLKYMTATRSYFLYNFLRLSDGDIAILPSRKEIRIVSVTGKPKVYQSKEGKDLGFVVPVKKVTEEPVSRYEYVPAKISSKLKYRGTNLEIVDAEERGMIDEMITNIKDKKVIYNFGKTKEKMVDLIQKYIKSNLTEDKLEYLIKSYFENMQADITEIPSKNHKNIRNDKIEDVDVKAAFNSLGLCFYVQAKHHRNQSNRHGINQVIEFKHDEDSRFSILQPVRWFVTTGTVSDVDFDYAVQNQVRVIQGTEFAEMLLDSGYKFSDETFVK